AAADQRRDPQPARIDDELLHERLGWSGLHRDAAREVGSPERDVDEIVAGLGLENRARLAIGVESRRLSRFALPLGMEDAPDEALADVLAIGREQRDETNRLALGPRTLIFAARTRHDRRVARLWRRLRQSRLRLIRRLLNAPAFNPLRHRI